MDLPEIGDWWKSLKGPGYAQVIAFGDGPGPLVAIHEAGRDVGVPLDYFLENYRLATRGGEEQAMAKKAKVETVVTTETRFTYNAAVLKELLLERASPGVPWDRAKLYLVNGGGLDELLDSEAVVQLVIRTEQRRTEGGE